MVNKYWLRDIECLCKEDIPDAFIILDEDDQGHFTAIICGVVFELVINNYPFYPPIVTYFNEKGESKRVPPIIDWIPANNLKHVIYYLMLDFLPTLDNINSDISVLDMMNCDVPS